MNGNEQAEKPTVAFLGPEGTFTHQAAHQFFEHAVQYSAKPTITETFASIVKPDSNTSYAFLPWENSFHGVVIDTYNLLREDSVGKRIFVVGELVLEVRHSLVVRKGTRMEDVRVVASHEQALAQCHRFLTENLPHAALVPVASTARAAQQIVDGKDGASSAAICSSIVVQIHPTLEILRDGIQDSDVNRTRFIVLSIRAEPEPSRAPLYRTLLRLSLPSNSLALGKSIASLSKSEDCIISRIDRRPSMHPTPFHDAVFVEVASDQKGQENLGSWRTTISKLVERVKSEVEDAEYTILGAW